MEFKKKTGVNYDYILALIKEGGRVKVQKYPIKRHDTQIERGISSYEDESCDAADVYYTVWGCLYNKSFPYCLAHEYTAAYIEDITPLKFDSNEYKRVLGDLIKREVERRVSWLPKSERINRDKIMEIKEDVWRRMYPKIKKSKEKLLTSVLPYIYASDYEDTLISNKIKETSIVYSSENHGDGRDNKKVGYHAEHMVTDDISVRIETNFCYGSSTYFNLIVTYKGIELLPYSVWVHYYYAGYAHLLRCTRSYERERNKWHDCMEFLESFINSALDNPEKFIHNEVMHEVNNLMLGLEKILVMNQAEFEKEISIKERPGDERYIGILGARYANKRDEEEYKIAPKEISMIYRMEKISGALRFLDNLRKIKDIYSEVSNSIERIIEMNKEIYPDVEASIPPVEEEIIYLNKELSPLKKKLNSDEVTFEKLEKRLERELQHIHNDDRIKEIKEKFEKRNPLYKELKEEIKKLNRKIYNIEDKIIKRESVLRRLNQYKSLILKYAL